MANFNFDSLKDIQTDDKLLKDMMKTKPCYLDFTQPDGEKSWMELLFIKSGKFDVQIGLDFIFSAYDFSGAGRESLYDDYLYYRKSLAKRKVVYFSVGGTYLSITVMDCDVAAWLRKLYNMVSDPNNLKKCRAVYSNPAD